MFAPPKPGYCAQNLTVDPCQVVAIVKAPFPLVAAFFAASEAGAVDACRTLYARVSTLFIYRERTKAD
jgi:hypothetical protein